MNRALALAAVLALGGCALGPRPEHLAVPPPVPASWPVGDAALAREEAALPLLSHREVFTDPRLQSLIALALANNRDLRIAAANIAEARARVRAVRANQFPEVGLGGGANYQRSLGGGSGGTGSVDGTDGGTGGTGIGTGTSTGGSAGRGRFDLDIGVSAFELDLFGRLANATAAERERALSTEAAARAVRLALVADIAEAWAAYGADRELLEIARGTAETAGRSVRLTRARLEGGIAPRTDLRQAEQVLATARDELALRTTAIAQDENLLRLLVGATFDPALLPADLGEVAAGIVALPAGTRSDVLLRRPDVIEAEYLLRAASADIAVARAELFPRITLTGLLGLASSALGSLVSSDAFSAGAGADVSYAIFDAGGRRANVAITRARQQAALASYERTIQSAFREVADALAVQAQIGERLRAAGANTAAAADTARLTEARYRGGVDSFLSSLDAQRSLFAAQQREVAARLELAQNRIALYRSLGGDQASPAVAGNGG